MAQPSLAFPSPFVVSPGGNRLLAALPVHDLALLSPYMTDRVLQAGSVLQEPGHTMSHVWFPRSGLISLLAVMPDGRGAEVALVGPEGAIGLSASPSPTVSFSRAVSHAGGTVAQIPADCFSAAARQSDAIRNVVERYNNMMLAQSQRLTACNSFHDVESRLARWLLQARVRIGSDTIGVTQETLSELLCVRRTTVTLICGRLQQADAIEIRRGRIMIREAGTLKSMACPCYGAMCDMTDAMMTDLTGPIH
jgi:CRP-like cAMP-binding protein